MTALLRRKQPAGAGGRGGGGEGGGGDGEGGGGDGDGGGGDGDGGGGDGDAMHPRALFRVPHVCMSSESISPLPSISHVAGHAVPLTM